MTRSAAAVLFMLGPLVGCAHEQLPAYPSVSGQQALQILRDRDRAVRTVSAQALVTLTRGNDQTVRLEAAVVLRPPDHARLRAWKLGQAVFDMTLTPDGLWVMAPTNDSRRRDILAAGSDTARFTRQWLQLIAGSFDGPGVTVDEAVGTLLVRESGESGTTIICEVDRKTVTPRRYVMTDRGGTERFTLALEKYSEVGGIIWPRKIEAVSGSGRILIELHDVAFNDDLPAGVFEPPARAEKLP